MLRAYCALQTEQIRSENEARSPLQVAQARHDTHCSGKAHEEIRDFFVSFLVSVSPDSAQDDERYEQTAAHVERGFLAGPTYLDRTSFRNSSGRRKIRRRPFQGALYQQIKGSDSLILRDCQSHYT